MKHTKKLAALLLALTLLLSLSVTAFAANDCSITINNAQPNVTYSAWKIFDVTVSGDATNPTYAYTMPAGSDWQSAIENFEVTYTPDGESTETTATYFKLTPSAGDPNTLVVTVAPHTGSGNSETPVTDIPADTDVGKKLAEALDAVTSKPTTTYTTTTAGTVGAVNSNTISNLPAGYYFVKSSLGSICSLETVNGTSVQIKEKNSYPNIDKQVFSPDSSKVTTDYTTDATNGTWKDEGIDDNPATVDVSQKVYYKLVIQTGDVTGDKATGINADYIIVDTLPTGFAYVNDIKITSLKKDAATGTSPTEWTTTDYTVTPGTNSTTNQPTITINLLNGTNKKLSTLTTADTITITYSATMTNSAVKIGAGSQTDAANLNTAVLYYQTDNNGNIERGRDTATVYTYQIGGTNTDNTPIIQKIDGATATAQTPTALNGVKFVLSKDIGTTGNPLIKYAIVDDSGYLTSWVNDQTGATRVETKTVDTVSGVLTVKGLDAGTYILTEVETLPGYNLMTDTITVVVAEDGTVKYKTTSTQDNPADTTIKIINEKGSTAPLPSTGGMGTTLFYILGGVLALGAAVLLVTRRRMRADK